MRRLLTAAVLFIAGAATGAGVLAAWTTRGESPAAVTKAADKTSTGTPEAPAGPLGTPKSPTITPTPAFAPGLVRPTAPPTPAPPVTRGLATPAGTFVLRRGDTLTLARLDGAGSEYELNAGSTGPRGFAGAVQTVAGLDLFFTESAAATTRDGQATVTLHRLPAIGGAPVPVVAYSFFGRFAAESASVSGDGRFIAYSSADGLHVRDLRSDDDRLVVASACQAASGGAASEPRPAVGFGGCQWVDVSPLWSLDARQLIFRRLYVEGSRWHSVDPLAASGTPLPMPWQFYRGWQASGARVCAADGDGYAGPPTTAFAYDFATSSARWLAVSPADIRRQRIVTGCALSRDGQMAVTFDDYSRSASRLVIFTERFDVARSFDAVGEVVAWLPDMSGVVLRDTANRSADQRPLFYLADRDGGLWSLAVDADEILAILP